ncbi:MAG: isoprenylcysteine carboxylmethyltransferase family protein [Actinomycetota bacterium]
MATTEDRASDGTRTGRLFVVVQFLLLVTLIAIPGADHWPVPTVVDLIGLALVLGGVALVVVAALRLGPALTPTPVPNERGQLTTTGLHGLVRHPIYTGVLAAVAGVTIRSGNVLVLLVAVGTVAFFVVKARWEEDRLRDRYPDYDRYAAGTPRFVPRIGLRR